MKFILDGFAAIAEGWASFFDWSKPVSPKVPPAKAWKDQRWGDGMPNWKDVGVPWYDYQKRK